MRAHGAGARAAAPRPRRSARRPTPPASCSASGTYAPPRVAPRRAPRLGVEHQREQAERLGLVRQQRDDAAGRARSPPRRGCGGGPRCRRGRTSPRRRRRRSPSSTASRRSGSSPRSGTRNGNAGLPDLALGAHQPLAHRRGRDQEGRGDRRGIEAEHGLQDQRRADAGLDRRMGAGEHQRAGGRRACPRRAVAAASAPRRSAADVGRRSPPRCAPPGRVDRLRRATVSSQASGLSGTPCAGQSASAAAKASASASSAPATSRVRAARKATQLAVAVGAPPPRRRACRRRLSCSIAVSALTSARPGAPRSRRGGAGAARRPGEGGVEIGHVDDVVAAELLLGLGVGAVEHLGLAVGDAHRGRRRRRPQAVAAAHDPGLAHRLGIGAVGRRASRSLSASVAPPWRPRWRRSAGGISWLFPWPGCAHHAPPCQ